MLTAEFAIGEWLLSFGEKRGGKDKRSSLLDELGITKYQSFSLAGDHGPDSRNRDTHSFG